jgi:hypothetical protein
LAGVASAQSDQERAGAREAATEGVAALNEGRYADAIDMFRRAETLVHAPTHLLLMARAHVKLGKLVQAREVYIKVTKEALAPTAPQPFRDAQAEAGRELAALEPRLARVTVKIEGDAKNLSVTADGEKVNIVLLGVPQPFDPGKHEFKAVADGMESKPQAVEVAEGGRQTVVLVLQPSAGATGASAAGSAAGTRLLTTATPLPGAETGTTSESRGNGMRIGAYAAFGVGALGVAAGVIFGLGAKSDYTKADDICSTPSGCPASRQGEIEDLDSSGNGKKTLATVGFIAGGVGIAAGTALFLLSQGGSGSKTADRAVRHARVEPQIGPGWIGVRTTF